VSEMNESVLRALRHDSEAELKVVTAQRDAARASLAQKDMDTRDMDEYDARWFALHDEIDRLRAELAEVRNDRANERAKGEGMYAAIARVREVAGDYWDWKAGKSLQRAILRALDGAE